jgi:hypothetical protein
VDVVDQLYADPLTAIIEWVNRSPIVGRGKPLAGGASDERRRSPGQGAYVYLTWIATARDGSDGDLTLPVLSGSVYGMDERNARKAAVAYAQLIARLDGDPITSGGALVLCADQVTGPSWIPDGREPRYLVDATFSITPA